MGQAELGEPSEQEVEEEEGQGRAEPRCLKGHSTLQVSVTAKIKPESGWSREGAQEFSANVVWLVLPGSLRK